MAIATDPSFEPFVEDSGLRFAPVAADPRHALQEDIGASPTRSASHAGRSANSVRWPSATPPSCWPCAKTGADLVLANPLAFAAFHVAERLEILCLPAYLQPVTPTASFVTSTGAEAPPWLPGRGRLNFISGHLSNQLFFRMMLPTINQCRQEVLGLQPLPWGLYARLDIVPEPIIYGYSPQVVPIPPDWGPWLHVTGYWFGEPDPAYRPPARPRSLSRGWTSTGIRRLRQHGRSRGAGGDSGGGGRAGDGRQARNFVGRVEQPGFRAAASIHSSHRLGAPLLALSADGRSGPPWRRGNDGGRLAGRRPVNHRAVLCRSTILGTPGHGAGSGTCTDRQEAPDG